MIIPIGDEIERTATPFQFATILESVRKVYAG